MFKQIAPSSWLIPKEGGMNVPGLVIATDALLTDESAKPLEQVKNVACLPGIVGYSIAMPDMHWGYGFPIGGVAAFDAENGIISPGGVGYDINCGVRLATLPLSFDALNEKSREKLINTIFRKVPSGIGKGHGHRQALSEADYQQLLIKGAAWAIEQGFGYPEDLEHMESHGVIQGASPEQVSPLAKGRGKEQLGTIGSGNHFVEIGRIEEIMDEETAKKWHLFPGQLYVLIHSGSRGLGHQVCQDTLDAFMQKGFADGLVDRQLAAAPIHSEAGKKYFQAMAAAANFAFNNRQLILHAVREAVRDVLGIDPKEVRLLYDVCHNIAKFEEYEVDGKKRKLCVHRKGATRAFGPKHPELAAAFQETGQPVLVPGDMGRASYILRGLGNPLSFCSCCHGAGRERSRTQSLKKWAGQDPIAFMKRQQVTVKAQSPRTIAEEMPDAYKDVNLVVQAVESAKLAHIVAKLTPRLVVKG
ncbi:MAG: rtcB [Chlamydiales bacterium]|jgi:tRNA-splicing ligase RtcB|nr:rtcB [Chlamydiales bacterium]